MSNNLMDTEPGGESTQYESISTVTHPHSKQEGHLGSKSEGSHSQAAYTAAPSQSKASGGDDRGARTTENIKYGQTISENQPTVSEGSGHVQVGYGVTPTLGGQREGVAERGDTEEKNRQNAGYGGRQDMDRNIGA